MGFFRKTITFALIAWAIYVQADGYKWNTAAPKQKKKWFGLIQ